MTECAPELTAPAPYLSDDERETVADLIDEEVDRISRYSDGGSSDTYRISDLESIEDRIRNVPTDPRLGTVLKRYEVHVLLKAIDLARPLIGGPLTSVYQSLNEIEAKLRALAKIKASHDRYTRHDDPDNWHTDDRVMP